MNELNKIRLTSISLLINLIFFSSLSGQNAEYRVDIPGVQVPISMVLVKGGEYVMGNNEIEDESPEHPVKIGDIWVSKTEITWQQYEAFVFRNKEAEQFISLKEQRDLGIDGITSATTPYVDMSFGMGKDNYPAINMTHYAALMYCKWLTAQTGQFYRLPTEAEWEYLCKSGWGDRIPDDSIAVYDRLEYFKVATTKQDDNGLYDILGNVSEWTMDKYDTEFYRESQFENPWNPPDKLYSRVTRGGSWQSTQDELTCTSRIPSESKWKKRDPQLPKSKWWLTNAPFVGFRIVKPAIQPKKKEIEKYWLEVIEDYGQ